MTAQGNLTDFYELVFLVISMSTDTQYYNYTYTANPTHKDRAFLAVIILYLCSQTATLSFDCRHLPVLQPDREHIALHCLTISDCLHRTKHYLL